MEQSLVLLVSLLLVSPLLCAAKPWEAPEFCHGKSCPEYEAVEKNQDFEKRHYVATEWITTKIEDSTKLAVIAASSRLRDFCNRLIDAGSNISDDSWPGLITINKEGHFLSWFVPPGTTKLETADPSVTLQSKPESTVYVRVFGGIPSTESGEYNKKMLLEALGNKCSDTYYGAGYGPYIALEHHNEVWINADDIKDCEEQK